MTSSRNSAENLKISADIILWQLDLRQLSVASPSAIQDGRWLLAMAPVLVVVLVSVLALVLAMETPSMLRQRPNCNNCNKLNIS